MLNRKRRVRGKTEEVMLFLYSNKCFSPQALAPIGALFGSVIAGFITNSFGRKPALLMVMVPYLIGYLLITYSQYVSGNGNLLAVLYTGRFFTGIGLGWSCLAVPVSLCFVCTRSITINGNKIQTIEGRHSMMT